MNVGYDPTSWYLDNLDIAWKEIYVKDPCKGWFGDISDTLCQSLVLGGHGEMWGETVDASDIAQTIWPRLAAIGERLWSPASSTEGGIIDDDLIHPDTEARLLSFRCLLNSRGIAAAPVMNQRARQAPSGPDSCYNQRRLSLV